MEKNVLTVKAALQIQKPADEVFEAIVNPDIMKEYFISYGSARMEEGKKLVWRFPEFDGDAPVRIKKIISPIFISFYWGEEGKELLVEMNLESQKDGSTVIRITEGGMENNDAGLQWLVGNTEGWANFLACMKAWLEYEVHLRKGAFDFMRG